MIDYVQASKSSSQPLLENFYTEWSRKTPAEIEFDIKVSIEKSGAALSLLEDTNIGPVNSVLEVGCGFGRNLVEVMNRTGASYGLGCDFSEETIEYAKKHYENKSIRFFRNSSLDIESTVSQLRKIYDKPFDLVILFDTLEHIPGPKTFIRALSSVSRYFLIKLPLEDSILDNYLLPVRKRYPCSLHPDGHLREFHVNNVHQFVVSLGLTPLKYDLYEYSINTLFPGHIRPAHLKGKLFFEMLRMIKCAARYMLPRRVFLRIIGGGGFVCLAKWDPEFVLE